MANPFDSTSVTDARLVAGTLWTPEIMLALLLRDYGVMERPFLHLDEAER